MVDGRVSFTGSGPGFVLDERSGFVYFTATEKDPRERHLYRVRLDGTGRTRLTREDGTHRYRGGPRRPLLRRHLVRRAARRRAPG